MAYSLRALDSYQCTNHAEREGIGLCVECRKVFCAECSTKIDGVNYCNGCLTQLSLSGEERPRRIGQTLQAIFAIGFVLVVFISLVAVGVGVGITVPSIRHVRIKAKAADNLRRLTEVRNALTEFKRDVGRYPTEEEGLEALTTDDPREIGGEIEGWNGPYLWQMGKDWDDKSVLDAYGAPIEYVATKSGDRLIASPGPDGAWNSSLRELTPPDDKGEGDDVVMWVEEMESENAGK